MPGASERNISELSFRGQFRAYQRTVFAGTREHAADGRIHIVAPPGAGKTVIGIELARKAGQPTVVFAPTTTIQQQWRETVDMFSDDAADLVSDDPARLATVNVFTYQLISTQAQADDDLRQAAELLWAETLVEEGKAAALADAIARIAEIRANNPSWYARESSRWRLKLRRQLLSEDPEALGRLLHPNARQLVDALVAAGVRTVVLDECHHLLDYWALVLRYLIGQIDRPVVIGLTATPPETDSRIEEENYFALLGEVDFEVPTPALVREGTLAPYRDLVYFVAPTDEELAFLDQAAEHLVAAQKTISTTDRFRQWLTGSLFTDAAAGGEGARAGWAAAVSRDALFAFSGLRVLRALDAPELLPAGLPMPAIVAQEAQFEDWTLVMERFALEQLAASADEDDHELLQQLKTSLKPFGMTLTERGLRRGQSPIDRILALSDAKAFALPNILRLEASSRGKSLRAAIVCDYDREQARSSLAGALSAGSARGVHAFLAADPTLAAALCPLLITATALAAPTSVAEHLCRRLEALADDPALELALAPGSRPEVSLIVARAGSWGTKRYVDLATRLLKAGEVRCLVGTRALLGEGWDAPSLNVLIDLTTVTTAQAVQQLRGRTIRLDPDDPDKLAHNWDVIAWAPLEPGGDNDLLRFLRRHEQTWGVVIETGSQQTRSDRTGPIPIERGARHVDPLLVNELEAIGLSDDGAHSRKQRKQKALDAATSRSRTAAGRRAEARAAWNIGGRSDGEIFEQNRVRLAEPLLTIGYITPTLRSLLIALLWTFLFGFIEVLTVAPYHGGFRLVSLLAFLGGLLASAGLLIRLVRRVLVEQPQDLIMLDIGRALALALAETKLIGTDPDTAARSVWCRTTPDYEIEIGFEGSTKEQRLFCSALDELFAPAADARYLIRRTDARLPGFLDNLVWRGLRSVIARLGGGSTKDHFVVVPRVFARSRKRAETFALHWGQCVGGGQLVDTRDPEAAQVVLEARSSSRLKALIKRIQRFGDQ